VVTNFFGSVLQLEVVGPGGDPYGHHWSDAAVFLQE